MKDGALADAEKIAQPMRSAGVPWALCAVALRGGRFYFQRDARCRAFIFLDQPLQLRRKFRIGCANRKALEEKSTFVQLLASEPLERLVVRLVHRVSLGRCMPLLTL
jgi:hypothetical protein